MFAKKTLAQKPTIAEIADVNDDTHKQKRSALFANTGITVAFMYSQRFSLAAL